MKIMTYNVNGLRQRISQFGTLLKLLDSFDADIICFQETKLRRQELTADLAVADGYESFFSCTRTTAKGRTGYSGVATFCRVKSAFSSTELALPVAAKEGFTGLVNNNNSNNMKGKVAEIARGLGEFERDELIKVDSEGRCLVTDHGHFVLFNVYGPRAESNDMERVQFKLMFFKILQKRWENLLHEGRRIFVVGDLNIAPTAMDCCDACPDFENNVFRRWFRSLLVQSGGHFMDIFRAKHPERRDAYTCWPSNSGAEQFNYGTRIDHILYAGSCLHQEHDLQGHNIVSCHVEDCDILTEYKRWKPGNTQRWRGGWNIKLEGSDHAPVFVSLVGISDVSQHSTPSLSARYLPMIHGLQQTLVSLFAKRQASTQVQSCGVLTSCSDGIVTPRQDSDIGEMGCRIPGSSTSYSCPCSQEDSDGSIWRADEHSKDFTDKPCPSNGTEIIMRNVKSGHISSVPAERTKKRARQSQWSQLSLRSFFRKSPMLNNSAEGPSNDALSSEVDELNSNHNSSATSVLNDQCSSPEHHELGLSACTQDQGEVHSGSLEKEKRNVALLEWQRIQQRMQSSIPLCKGHKEPCIARIVKKPGPTSGHRFYVCARAEGPASNPEANCGYFKWASSKFRVKG